MTNPPQKLGRYEVLEEIGKGAMGVVYVARDPLIGRQVALKTFRVGFSAKDQELQQFRSRFVREAQSAGILSHPNIVTIHDVIDEGEGGVCFIAMEFVKGTNLKQLLQRSEPFTHSYVVNIVAQIAEALDYAHSRGVVHRDIKPANILITPEDKVKITDFGIARLDTSNLTMEGQLLGTPNYMAPEQIQGKEVDHRADIFSLGVVFYEMLTRKKPFQGENLTAVTHKIVYEPFTPPEDLVADLPAGLAAVLRRCLEKDPNRRYPRASEIAAELKKSWNKAAAEDEDTSATQEVPPVGQDGADDTVEKTIESTRPAPEQARKPSPAPVSPRAGSPVAPPPPVAAPAPASFAAGAKSFAAAASPPAPAAAAARTANVPSLPTPVPSVPMGQSSGEMQVSAALKRIRNQRVVQWGLVSAALISLAAIFALWLSDGGAPSTNASAVVAAAEEAKRAGIAAALAEAREDFERGDLHAALGALAKVEAADPENAAAKELHARIDAASAADPAVAEREQKVDEGLTLARGEFDKRRYEAAATAARAVLEISPGNEEATRILGDSETALTRAKERERARAAAPPKAASTPPSPAPAVAVARTVEPAAPAGDAKLGISFSTDVSEGVLTIYAGERQIVREPFKFVRKTGFLRSEKISGTLNFERTLPAGTAALRVYVSLPGKPTKSVLVEGVLAAGAAPQLDIRVDGEGLTTAKLQ